MRDMIPEWIQSYKDFQQMPLELIGDVFAVLEKNPDNEDALDIKKFLEQRYAILQHEINKLQETSDSGSKVWLMNDDERAGWDARGEADKLKKTMI